MASVGSTYTAVLVEQLSRAHIAQYAGASGDFNLVHTDERFAIDEAHRPSVIAHGMLTMGLTATFVTQIVGHGRLMTFGGRFLAPVLPRQRLTGAITVAEVDQSPEQVQITLDVVTCADDATQVFDGYAVARAAWSPATPGTL